MHVGIQQITEALCLTFFVWMGRERGALQLLAFTASLRHIYAAERDIAAFEKWVSTHGDKIKAAMGADDGDGEGLADTPTGDVLFRSLSPFSRYGLGLGCGLFTFLPLWIVLSGLALVVCNSIAVRVLDSRIYDVFLGHGRHGATVMLCTVTFGLLFMYSRASMWLQ